MTKEEIIREIILLITDAVADKQACKDKDAKMGEKYYQGKMDAYRHVLDLLGQQ